MENHIYGFMENLILMNKNNIKDRRKEMADIKSDISKENYKEFIKYMCNNSTVICFTITTYDYI